MNGNYFLQGKMPGVKSVISKSSNAKADLLVEHGDNIYFGNLFLEGHLYALLKNHLLSKLHFGIIQMPNQVFDKTFLINVHIVLIQKLRFRGSWPVLHYEGKIDGFHG